MPVTSHLSGDLITATIFPPTCRTTEANVNISICPLEQAELINLLFSSGNETDLQKSRTECVENRCTGIDINLYKSPIPMVEYKWQMFQSYQYRIPCVQSVVSTCHSNTDVANLLTRTNSSFSIIVIIILFLYLYYIIL